MKISPSQRRSRLRFLATATLVLLLTAPAAAQEFVARVDRQRVFENETLTLEVVYAERADTESIDFDAQLSDFSILTIRPTSQTRYVNGRRSSQTSWQLTLSPKRKGRLRIPAFTIGKQRTRPIDIRVDEAPDGPENGAAFSARLTVDRERAFVGEQILATISLSATRDIGGLQGSALEVDGAEVQLVNQREFQRVFEGTPYQITELVYAVFPQRPGPLSFLSAEYRGVRRRSQRVVARTQPRVVEVLDPATDPEAGAKRPFFPASGVALASEWSQPDRKVRLGEPITRTLRVAAAGQRAAAIAPLTLAPGDFKEYKEQPELNDSETSAGILGTRTESFVLVPTKAGPLRLPPIEIDWWNVETRRWEKARIPEETLQVEPAASGPAEGSPMSSAAGAPNSPTEAPGLDSREPENPSWLTNVLAALCLILGFGCILLWRRVRVLEKERSDPRKTGARGDGPGFDSPGVPRNEAAARRRLEEAIAHEEANETRRALLEWARVHWPGRPIASLEQLSELVGELDEGQDTSILQALDARLYGREAEREDPLFDFARLSRWLDEVRRMPRPSSSGKDTALPELYPRA